MDSEEFTFRGKTYDEMVYWLRHHGLDVANFNKTALKPLPLLWEEHTREVVLRWDAERQKILRVARTVFLIFVVGDFVLTELMRVYPKGVVKKNHWWSISETLLLGESSILGAIRGFREECKLDITNDLIDDRKWAMLSFRGLEPYESSTYPGIWTCAIPHWIEVRRDTLPAGFPRVIKDRGVKIHLGYRVHRPPQGLFSWQLTKLDPAVASR